MKNSGQSFQRLIEDILRGIPGTFIYLDDILAFHKTEEEHLAAVEEILKRLAESGMTIALNKCDFGVRELQYLGYHVNRDGIRPVEKKI